MFAVALSEDASLLVAASEDSTINLWRAGSDPIRVTGDDTGPLFALALSRDQSTLITGGDDGVVRTWDMASIEAGGRAPIARWAPHHGRVTCLAISPSGTVVASGGDDGIVLVRRLSDGHTVQPSRSEAQSKHCPGATSTSRWELSAAFASCESAITPYEANPPAGV